MNGDARHGHLISHAQPVRRLIDDGHILVARRRPPRCDSRPPSWLAA